MKHFDIISPVDQSVFQQCTYDTIEKIHQILDYQTTAQQEWQATSLQQKQSILHRALMYFVEHEQAIAQEITWQMGRPAHQALAELKGLKQRADYMLSVAESSLADNIIEDSNMFKKYIRHQPLGCVFIIAPWNYPYLTVINSLIPALLSGNSIILKHAEQTALCGQRFRAAFEQAGLPKGLFEAIHLSHPDCEHLLKHASIQGLAFTGSKQTGLHLQAQISHRCLMTNFELGGHDSAYVRQDAPLQFTVDNLVDGAFYNAGQSCCGIRRIYVHKNCYHAFIEAFVETSKRQQVGNPFDEKTQIGPVVSIKAAQHIQEKIQSALSAGAKLLYGTQSTKQPYPNYLLPHIITNTNQNMPIMQEELFGPVVMIQSVDSDHMAIEHMNDCQYGLTGSIWSQAHDEAESLLQKCQVGTGFVNRCDYLDPALPWAGVKNSGTGISLSHLGFQHFTRPKGFHIRKNA